MTNVAIAKHPPRRSPQGTGEVPDHCFQQRVRGLLATADLFLTRGSCFYRPSSIVELKHLTREHMTLEHFYPSSVVHGQSSSVHTCHCRRFRPLFPANTSTHPPPSIVYLHLITSASASETKTVGKTKSKSKQLAYQPYGNNDNSV
jgi:hypothetical protein